MPTLVVWDVKTVLDLKVYTAATVSSAKRQENQNAIGTEDQIRSISQSYALPGLSLILRLIDGLSTSVSADHVASKPEQELINN